MECFDDDVKVYRKYSYEEMKRYVLFYLKECREGIDFNDLFQKCHKYLTMKNWLLKELHKQDSNLHETVNVNDIINDYTMNILKKFFVLDYSHSMFIFLEENFIAAYVRNESILEGVNDVSIHGKKEMKGLEEMYKYIISKEEKSSTGSILLTDLHEKLFCGFDDGRFSRSYRRDMAYLPFSGVELEEPLYIPRRMREMDRLFDELCTNADAIHNCPMENRTYKVELDKDGRHIKTNMVNSFLEKLMRYNAELIRIHPFPDGNGRSVRGIVNYLLIRAGLPPVYVKTVERAKYHEAMNKAIVENNYELLVNFYKNKFCDSIEELIVDPFEHAIKQYRTQLRKRDTWEQEGSNLQRVLTKNSDGEFVPKNPTERRLYTYIVKLFNAKRGYKSNVKMLLDGKKTPKNYEQLEKHDSNVLRLFRNEEKSKKNRM